MPDPACRVCGSTRLTPLVLEEMMFGSREPFDYNECAACGSLSIAQVPADLADHYPRTYYSFSAEHRPRFGFVARRLAVLALLNMPVRLSRRLPARMSRWRGMRAAGVKRSTRILDVGCGNGALLRSLERSGFTDLHGVDPFIDSGGQWPHITLIKGELANLEGPYRFILVSHSLEHMPDPGAALREVARICSPGGHILISVPVVNRSWRDVGADWNGLDPPRHLFIPTVSALTALVNSVPGLRVRATWFDTAALELYGNELARLRLPLFDRATGAPTDPTARFGKDQMAAWARTARDYNARGEAGTASLLIQRH